MSGIRYYSSCILIVWQNIDIDIDIVQGTSIRDFSKILITIDIDLQSTDVP